VAPATVEVDLGGDAAATAGELETCYGENSIHTRHNTHTSLTESTESVKTQYRNLYIDC
jgi:hypothetical protein